MSAGFERFTRAIARRPLQALLIVAVLAIGGAVLALRLKPSTGIGTFVSSGSSSYQATLDDEHHFGSDAVVVLIREPLTDLVETKDLGTLSFLEACLAGKVVQRNLQLGAYTEVSGQAPYGGWGSPCGKADAQPARQGRLRAGDLPQPRRRGNQPDDRDDDPQRAAVDRKGKARRLCPRARRAQGSPEGPTARAGRRQPGPAARTPAGGDAGLSVRAYLAASDRQPAVHLASGVRCDARF